MRRAGVVSYEEFQKRNLEQARATKCPICLEKFVDDIEQMDRFVEDAKAQGTASAHAITHSMRRGLQAAAAAAAAGATAVAVAAATTGTGPAAGSDGVAVPIGKGRWRTASAPSALATEGGGADASASAVAVAAAATPAAKPKAASSVGTSVGTSIGTFVGTSVGTSAACEAAGGGGGDGGKESAGLAKPKAVSVSLASAALTSAVGRMCGTCAAGSVVAIEGVMLSWRCVWW